MNKPDLAPGEPHVALRTATASYYNPALLHLSPTHDKVVPLAICDILKSKSCLEIYGVQGLDLHTRGHIMVSNYAVKTVRIVARVMLYQHVCFSNKNYYILYVDDFSGDSLCISVKVQRQNAAFLPAAMKEDVLVDITGTVFYSPNFQRQLVARTASVIGFHTDTHLELQWWNTVLQARVLLQTPWVYTHPDLPSAPTIAPRAFGRDPTYQEGKQRMFPPFEVCHTQSFASDSLPQADQPVIDLTSDDDESLAEASRTGTASDHSQDVLLQASSDQNHDAQSDSSSQCHEFYTPEGTPNISASDLGITPLHLQLLQTLHSSAPSNLVLSSFRMESVRESQLSGSSIATDIMAVQVPEMIDLTAD